MYRRKTYRRKAPKKTYKRKSYAPKKSRSSVKREVAIQLARNVENKSVQSYIYARNLFGTPAASSDFLNNLVPLGPSASGVIINQGATSGTRIGNKIKTKKLMFKGTIVAFPFNASTNQSPKPLQVKLWIFYDKSQPTVLPNPPTNGDFLQNGGTNKSFQDDLTDLWSPVNTDRYRVLTTRTFKLGNANYLSNGTGYLAQNYFANNDFKYNANFSLDLTKYYPKMVKYNDASTTPTTRGLFAMFTVSAADGGPIGAVDIPAGVQWMQDYHYEDA